MTKTLGIFCGGGPAPGINGVISAASIEAINRGWRVLGLREGLRWIGEGRTDMVRELDISDISRIHFTGGSILGISRRGNVEDPEERGRMIAAIQELGIDALISIGGDGTSHAARVIAREIDIPVVHVPKTIDNDIPLPGGMATFGFQTARDFGVELVQALMEDARTCQRWYFVVTMGRNAGHLALGIGKAAGAPLTLIPEEFEGGATIEDYAKICEASILRRLEYGRRDGVVILAEGLAHKLHPSELQLGGECGVDAHGHVRLNDLPLGYALRQKVAWTLEQRGVAVTIMEKNIGYELRCKNPVPFDIEYTRDLGFGAMRAIERGQRQGIVCLEMGKIRVIPFEEFEDRKTGRTKVRLVDLDSESYLVSLAYQLRLRRKDLEDDESLQKLSEVSGMSKEYLRERYSSIAVP
jgi:6-phosphofructokinase